MALFGLFNYAKEGPGIEKDAPQKKTFVVFFETYFRNFWKFIPINLIYCLLSVPVLSNGISSVGLTNVARNIARDKHSFGMSDFWETIKKNWKQALPAGIINFIIYLILGFDMYFFVIGVSGLLSGIGIGVCVALIFMFTVMNYYISTMIITFKFTLKQIYKNSFKFVFINMKMNLLCFLVTTIIYVFFFSVAYFFGNFYIVGIIEFAILICCVPSFRFLLTQYCIFPSVKKYVIDPYYAEHPDEDLDLRHNLGFDDAEQGDDEESIFNDNQIISDSANKD